MIINTKLISVWDGIQEIVMDCKLNTDTKQVFDINMPNIADNFTYFQGFYLNIEGILHPVVSKDIAKDGQYWHE